MFMCIIKHIWLKNIFCLSEIVWMHAKTFIVISIETFDLYLIFRVILMMQFVIFLCSGFYLKPEQCDTVSRYLFTCLFLNLKDSEIYVLSILFVNILPSTASSKWKMLYTTVKVSNLPSYIIQTVNRSHSTCTGYLSNKKNTTNKTRADIKKLMKYWFLKFNNVFIISRTQKKKKKFTVKNTFQRIISFIASPL